MSSQSTSRGMAAKSASWWSTVRARSGWPAAAQWSAAHAVIDRMPSASPYSSQFRASAASAAVSPACRAMPARSVCSTASTSADPAARPAAPASRIAARAASRSPVSSACMPRRDAAKNATRADPDSVGQQVERAQLAADGRAVEDLERPSRAATGGPTAGPRRR